MQNRQLEFGRKLVDCLRSMSIELSWQERFLFDNFFQFGYGMHLRPMLNDHPEFAIPKKVQTAMDRRAALLPFMYGERDVAIVLPAQPFAAIASPVEQLVESMRRLDTGDSRPASRLDWQPEAPPGSNVAWDRGFSRQSN